MSLKELAESLRPAFIKKFAEYSLSPCCLFLSASDMKDRAYVCHSVAEKPEEAWENTFAALEKTLAENSVEEPSILRADWATAIENTTWTEFIGAVKSKKPNWFRKGIILDSECKMAFTEQELNSNRILDNEAENKRGDFCSARANEYCQRRFGCDWPQIGENDSVALFDTDGVFFQQGMTEPLDIVGKGLSAGHRNIPQKDDKIFLDVIKTACNYLVNQCDEEGKFVYGFYPCEDSVIPSYSIHRHFGTLFAMADAYTLYEDGAEKNAVIETVSRGLEWALKTSVISRKNADGEDIICFKQRKAIDIGMSGLALLAFTKYTEVTKIDKYIPVMRAIARGIFSFQKADGSFTQAFNVKDFSVRKEFVITFYDGEALFALLRLYAITKDKELLDCVEKAIHCFNEKNYWENHDHWMGYVFNELTIWRPEEKYFKFGLDNTLPFLPKLFKTSSPSPTRLEMTMAAENMICRLKSLEGMDELRKRLNDDTFYATVNRVAERLLNTYFWSETAMYFKKPGKMVGGFFARSDKFRTRIDDVQHTISGLIAYYKYLKGEKFTAADFSYVAEKSQEKISEPKKISTEKIIPVEKIIPTENIPTEKISADSLKRMVVEAEHMRVTFEMLEPVKSPKVVQPAEEISPAVRPLRVGVMKRVHPNFWEPDNARFPMFCMANQFNIELFFFNPKDIDFTNKTVKASFLENGVRVQKTVPLPRIVDNDMTLFRGDNGVIMQKLKKYCYLVRPADNEMRKKKFFDTLSKEGSFNKFLIDTHNVNDFETFVSLFEKYDSNVILKPFGGVGGGGVAHVSREGDKYSINLKTDVYTFENIPAMSDFYKENFTKRKYLLQPYITSRTRNGNPFDIRLHARRAAEGKFKIIPYPRIGNADGVVSNVASGGYSMDIQTFLKTEFGKDWKNLYERLLDLGNKFPDYYQTFFDFTIVDIGIDVGIQRRGDSYELKIFEAYSQPGFKIIKIDVALANFEYYKYLDKKLNDGTLKIG